MYINNNIMFNTLYSNNLNIDKIGTHVTYPLRDISNPVPYTADVVRNNAENLSTGNKWADIEDPDINVLGNRITFHNDIKGIKLKDSSLEYDEENKKFKFPIETGIIGRGLLGRYGPNQAADPIVTRFIDGKYQVLLITRADCNTKAFPGGMVDPGKDVPFTLYNELTEEACKDSKSVKYLFNNCKKGIVYRGIVLDPRTTNHAWIETTACWFHADDRISEKLELSFKDPDEIKGVNWYNISEIDNLYASHIDWLNIIKHELGM